MKDINKTARIIYCALAGLMSLLVIVLFAINYNAFGEKVPVYLAPWGGSWGEKAKSVFYVFRMPVMAICLQGMLVGCYPERMEGYTDAVYSSMRVFLMGLSLITLSQLTLNPYFTFAGTDAILRGIILCATLAMGLAQTVIAYIRLHKALKPLCTDQQTPFSMLLELIVKGSKRRRVLLIAAVVAFMVLLVIPSL